MLLTPLPVLPRPKTSQQVEELLQLAQTQAEENVGMAMGYTIAESLKEWLADNNVPSAVDG